MANLDNTTAKKIEVILEMIGTEANALRDAMSSAVVNGTALDASHTYLLESIASKIGYFADAGLRDLTGSESICGNADKWFLPPSYHNLAATAGTNHD